MKLLFYNVIIFSETIHDSIVAFYSPDGIEYVEKIEQKFPKHDITVNRCLLSSESNPDGKRQCAILLLTPDAENFFRRQNNSELFTKIFDKFKSTAVLCHELVDLKNNSVLDHIAQYFSGVDHWKVIHMDGTKIGFKKALLDVMSIVESPTSAPLLNLYTLVPSVISSVSYMLLLSAVSELVLRSTKVDKSNFGRYLSIRTFKSMF